MNSIRRYFALYNLRNLIKSRKIPVSIGLKEGNLILFHILNNADLINAEAELTTLENEGETADFIFLTTFEMAPGLQLQFPSSLVLNQKDLNFGRLPKHETLSRLDKKAYRVLINTCANDCLALDYVAAYANAELKLSPYKDNSLKIYNLLLSRSQNESPQRGLLALCFYYLQKISVHA